MVVTAGTNLIPAKVQEVGGSILEGKSTHSGRKEGPAGVDVKTSASAFVLGIYSVTHASLNRLGSIAMRRNTQDMRSYLTEATQAQGEHYASRLGATNS